MLGAVGVDNDGCMDRRGCCNCSFLSLSGAMVLYRLRKLIGVNPADEEPNNADAAG